MSPLERYTPHICSQLRQLAESRQWHLWDTTKPPSTEFQEDVQLTYHLHLAADASGSRAGMPPMPRFPIRLHLSADLLDPAEFIRHYLSRHPPAPWNHSDNRPRSRAICA